MTTPSSKLQQNASISTKNAQMSIICLICHQYQGDKKSKECFMANHFKRRLIL